MRLAKDVRISLGMPPSTRTATEVRSVLCSNSDGRKYYYHHRLSANFHEGSESHINSQGSHFKPRLRTSIHMDGGLKDIVFKPL